MPGTATEEAQSVRYWLTDKGLTAVQAAAAEVPTETEEGDR